MTKEATYSDRLLEHMHSGVDLFAGLEFSVRNAVIAGVCAFLALLLVWFFHTPKKGRKMRPSSSQEVAANIVTKGFNDALEKGEITAKFQQHWFKKIGKGAGIPDLLRKQGLGYKVHPYKITLIKECIKQRLKEFIGVDGTRKPPVKLPEPAPELTAREKLAKFTAKKAA